MNLIIYTDGASRGNPGHSSYGFTIQDESRKLLYEKGEYIGIATNNIAEYTAVLAALDYIKENFSNKPVNIQFFMDSRLVVEQLSGRFKIKSPHLKLIIEKIQILALELGGAIFTHVPRVQNFKADKLANMALDSR